MRELRHPIVLVCLLAVLGMVGFVVPDVRAGMDDDLIGHWNFNDGLGEVAKDSKGAHDGTLMNGPVWEGTGNSANPYWLKFDGDNDYISIATPEDFYPKSARTYCGWVKPNDANYNVFMSFNEKLTPALEVHQSRSGAPLTYLGSDNYRYFASAGWEKLKDGNWHHVCYLVAGMEVDDIKKAKMWLDGVELSSGSTVAREEHSEYQFFNIGSASAYDYAGLMDEVKVFGKNLSNDEVKAEYEAGKSLFEVAEQETDLEPIITLPICPFKEQEKRTLIQFNELVRADKDSGAAITEKKVINIEPGTYRVQLATFDDHTSKAKEEESNEIWKLRFEDYSGQRIETKSTDDLLSSVNLQTFLVEEELVIAKTVVGAEGVHSYFSLEREAAPESFVAVCAALDLISPPEAVTVSPELEIKGQCGDAEDNDGDGKIDKADPECVNQFGYHIPQYDAENVAMCTDNGIQSSMYVRCTTGGQLCSPKHNVEIEITKETPLYAEYSVGQGRVGEGRHCSSVRVHVFLDGVKVKTSSYLGWPDNESVGLLSTGNMLLASKVAVGKHTVSWQAEGQTGGCNSGSLSSWSGTGNIYTVINQCEKPSVLPSPSVVPTFIPTLSPTPSPTFSTLPVVNKPPELEAPLSLNIKAGQSDKFSVTARDNEGDILGIRAIDNNARYPANFCGLDLGERLAKDLLVHYKLDEGSGSQAIDASGNNINGQMYGSFWRVSDEASKAFAAHFDGNDDYIEMNDNRLYRNERMSASLWVYLDDVNGRKSLITSGYSEGRPYWHTVIDGSDIRTYFGTGYSTVAAGLVPNKWTHIVFTAGEGMSSAGKVYVDGVVKGTFNRKDGNGSGVYIGRYRKGYSYSGWFSGEMDDVRVYERELSGEEVRALYDMENINREGRLPQTKKKEVVAYWNMDEGNGVTLTDNSGRGLHATLINAPEWIPNGIIENPYSIGFDGQNDYISTKVSGNEMFTWSVWVMPSELPDKYQSIMNIPGEDHMLMDLYGNNGSFWSKDGLNGEILGVEGLTVNEWYHLALVREGNQRQGGYKAYLNGQLKGEFDTGTWNSGDVLWLGGRRGVAQYFSGRLDEVQVFSYALSADEIAQIYNKDEADFQSSLSLRGLVGHWKFDDGTGESRVKDSSGYGIYGTLSRMDRNNAWVAGGPYKQFENAYALDFDGVDDKVILAKNKKLDLSSNFTLSAWIVPKGRGSHLSAGGVIMVKENMLEFSRFADGTIRWAFNNSNPGWRWHDTRINTPTNQWSHVLITYGEDGQIDTYLNGKKEDSYVGAGKVAANRDAIWIGGRSSASQFFQGTIDDVRVYNRVLNEKEIEALYTGKEPME